MKGANATHTFADNGTYKITLSVSDEDNGTTTTTQTVVINNVAPTPSIDSISAPRLEGTSISFAGSATDPAGANDTLTFVWNFGDGSAVVTGSNATHTFADNGTYKVTLTVSDEDNGTTTTTQTIVISNVAPTPVVHQTVVEANASNFVINTGTVFDPGDDTVTLAASIGTVTMNSNGTWTWTYDASREIQESLIVTITAADEDGGSRSVSFTAVINLPPELRVSGRATGVRGQALDFVFTATDPNAVDQTGQFTFVINWGDGTPVQTVTGLATTVVSHVYVAEAIAAYSIRATVRDARGLTSVGAAADVDILRWEVQADPLHAGQIILVVGGSMTDDRLRVTRHGTGADAYFKLRIDALASSDYCNDDEENNSTVRIYAALNGIMVYGQSGNDRIELQNKIEVRSLLDGGLGNDRIQGGAAANIILGGDGDDQLLGGQGRDVMIGGRGSDYLDGGKDDDLLIAGYTSLDNNRSALEAVLREWTSDRSFTDRRNNIMGVTSTGLNGTSWLKPSGPKRSVFDDDAVDYLWGGEGRDWFLLNMDSAESSRRDQLIDFRNGDEDDDINLF